MAGEGRRTSDWWNTIDFRPAPPGWRVVFLWSGVRELSHIAGWLIQERYSQGAEDPYLLNKELGDDEAIFGRTRRVVPGVLAEGHNWVVQAIDDNLGDLAHIWQILPPGAPEPTDEEEQAERAKRARKKDGGEP